MNCKICNKEVKSLSSLGIHLTSAHKELDKIEYYLSYINTEESIKCKFCENQAKFTGVSRGFKKNCNSDECISKSRAPFSKEYKMKVDGLSEDEYNKWSIQDKITKKRNTEIGFEKKRKENPDFDKENSRYCKEYWIKKGYSVDDSIKKAYNESKINRDKLIGIRNRDPDYMKGKSWASKDYWIKKGYTEKEAISIVSEKQETFSLKKCIEKYGEIEGKRKWIDRQERWNKSYKKTNYSRKSQKLFWSILETNPIIQLLSPRFATFDNGIKDDSGTNHELVITTNNRSIKPDFIIGNKIIEFDGIYWHDFKRRGVPENKKREIEKDNDLKNSGYEILRINELEYDTNNKVTTEKCIIFLLDDRT